ncbi:hypothetical protein CEUSTIGMA_g9078.t1 [Chlamydomonas eustigma]|uniref:guanylate cyclase n=1 Tax=Chlamydomonas eustigma TaxID=1157962 RepID=A0A250XFT4_9CHLO|nr:hypothetical protein CEUSTIGMA_g9078.t1 [Chlamydomonas eustigma]|eukprot:GAX81650.1 hypothetical protein CEUSTIGMA_g9078.t1 [Chlamydomonas eustigma]
MNGLLNIAFEAFISEIFGAEALNDFKRGPGTFEGLPSSWCPSADHLNGHELFSSPTASQNSIAETILEFFGEFLTGFLHRLGYSYLLYCLGSNIAELAERLDDLHLLIYSVPNCSCIPSFRVEEVTVDSLILHCYSQRHDYWALITGLLKVLSQDLFGHDLKVILVRGRTFGTEGHEVLKICYPAHALQTSHQHFRKQLLLSPAPSNHHHHQQAGRKKQGMMLPPSTRSLSNSTGHDRTSWSVSISGRRPRSGSAMSSSSSGNIASLIASAVSGEQIHVDNQLDQPAGGRTRRREAGSYRRFTTTGFGSSVLEDLGERLPSGGLYNKLRRQLYNDVDSLIHDTSLRCPQARRRGERPLSSSRRSVEVNIDGGINRHTHSSFSVRRSRQDGGSDEPLYKIRSAQAVSTTHLLHTPPLRLASASTAWDLHQRRLLHSSHSSSSARHLEASRHSLSLLSSDHHSLSLPLIHQSPPSSPPASPACQLRADSSAGIIITCNQPVAVVPSDDTHSSNQPVAVVPSSDDTHYSNAQPVAVVPSDDTTRSSNLPVVERPPEPHTDDDVVISAAASNTRENLSSHPMPPEPRTDDVLITAANHHQENHAAHQKQSQPFLVPPTSCTSASTATHTHSFSAAALPASSRSLLPLREPASLSSCLPAGGEGLLFGPQALHSVFPFHFAVDERLVVVQAGPGLKMLLPGSICIGVTRMKDIIQIERPLLCPQQDQISFSTLQLGSHASFILKALTSSASGPDHQQQTGSSAPLPSANITVTEAHESATLIPAGVDESMGSSASLANNNMAAMPDDVLANKALRLKGQFVVGDFFWMETQVLGTAAATTAMQADCGSPATAKIPAAADDEAIREEAEHASSSTTSKSSSSNVRRLAVFLGSPMVESLADLVHHGLTLYNLPIQDRSIDMALQSEQAKVELSIREGYEELTLLLEDEKERSESLLYRCVPKEVAQRLREGQQVEAQSFNEVTIMFTDIVDFTSISSAMQPMEVCRMLSELYERFDSIIELYPDVWKADIIGDSYMLVSNLNRQVPDHVDQTIDLAIQLQLATREACPWLGRPLMIRIGIHTGPAAAGVIGGKSSAGVMRYSIYGDTVNTASRMESHGVPGKIHISQASYDCIHEVDKYAIQERGRINVKGKGQMVTYLISSHQAAWLLQPGNQEQAERRGMAGTATSDEDDRSPRNDPLRFSHQSTQSSYNMQWSSIAAASSSNRPLGVPTEQPRSISNDPALLPLLIPAVHTSGSLPSTSAPLLGLHIKEHERSAQLALPAAAVPGQQQRTAYVRSSEALLQPSSLAGGYQHHHSSKWMEFLPLHERLRLQQGDFLARRQQQVSRSSTWDMPGPTASSSAAASKQVSNTHLPNYDSYPEEGGLYVLGGGEELASPLPGSGQVPSQDRQQQQQQNLQSMHYINSGNANFLLPQRERISYTSESAVDAGGGLTAQSPVAEGLGMQSGSWTLIRNPSGGRDSSNRSSSATGNTVGSTYSQISRSSSATGTSTTPRPGSASQISRSSSFLMAAATMARRSGNYTSPATSSASSRSPISFMQPLVGSTRQGPLMRQYQEVVHFSGNVSLQPPFLLQPRNHPPQRSTGQVHPASAAQQYIVEDGTATSRTPTPLASGWQQGKQHESSFSAPQMGPASVEAWQKLLPTTQQLAEVTAGASSGFTKGSMDPSQIRVSPSDHLTLAQSYLSGSSVHQALQVSSARRSDNVSNSSNDLLLDLLAGSTVAKPSWPQGSSDKLLLGGGVALFGRGSCSSNSGWLPGREASSSNEFPAVKDYVDAQVPNTVAGVAASELKFRKEGGLVTVGSSSTTSIRSLPITTDLTTDSGRLRIASGTSGSRSGSQDYSSLVKLPQQHSSSSSKALLLGNSVAGLHAATLFNNNSSSAEGIAERSSIMMEADSSTSPMAKDPPLPESYGMGSVLQTRVRRSSSVVGMTTRSTASTAASAFGTAGTVSRPGVRRLGQRSSLISSSGTILSPSALGLSLMADSAAMQQQQQGCTTAQHFALPGGDSNKASFNRFGSLLEIDDVMMSREKAASSVQPGAVHVPGAPSAAGGRSDYYPGPHFTTLLTGNTPSPRLPHIPGGGASNRPQQQPFDPYLSVTLRHHHFNSGGALSQVAEVCESNDSHDSTAFLNNTNNKNNSTATNPSSISFQPPSSAGIRDSHVDNSSWRLVAADDPTDCTKELARPAGEQQQQQMTIIHYEKKESQHHLENMAEGALVVMRASSSETQKKGGLMQGDRAKEAIRSAELHGSHPHNMSPHHHYYNEEVVVSSYALVAHPPCSSPPRALLFGWQQPLAAVQHERLPLAAVQHDRLPLAAVQHDRLPLAAVEHDRLPLVAVQHDRLPLAAVEHDRLPLAAVEHDRLPLAAVEHDRLPRMNQPDTQALLPTPLDGNTHGGSATIAASPLQSVSDLLAASPASGRTVDTRDAADQHGGLLADEVRVSSTPLQHNDVVIGGPVLHSRLAASSSDGIHHNNHNHDHQPRCWACCVS